MTDVLKRLRRFVAIPALRRAIVTVCAIAFLTVTFAHAGSHADCCLPAPSSAIEVAVAADGSGSKATPSVDICAFCVLAALPLHSATGPTLLRSSKPHPRHCRRSGRISRTSISARPSSDLNVLRGARITARLRPPCSGQSHVCLLSARSLRSRVCHRGPHRIAGRGPDPLGAGALWASDLRKRVARAEAGRQRRAPAERPRPHA